MNIIVDDTATANARHSARLRPVEHRSSQISAGPQYVADVLGRFGAESADAADAGDAAPAVLGYN
ncbi:TPA: hypothetical protein SAO08_000039 [Burkholderia multivorans]|uniref:hypothetical protein n=1 Tax=Burkholderia multivorans TaxID=87883 RepID=UPI000CFEB048|nr:hypothetical protein [Burkholderia multivorans]MBU9313496.1 hypothetical protein [Burkholderia multivorans]MBU9333771.1 hypothetical protein [Burkholderia multivorans]MCO1463260.1 hypothetical protein [Burkholderia multivorans]MDN7939330.1 hypothetical protein [Burkholderia multivorans]PRF31558.1 hypothetical protein C6Q08_16540 [Burkholderia multivorans]